MEVHEARRLKDLERENTELKKMLAESLLKNRVLEAVCEKKALSPAHRRVLAQQAVEEGMCSRRAACRILRSSRPTASLRARWTNPTKQPNHTKHTRGLTLSLAQKCESRHSLV